MLTIDEPSKSDNLIFMVKQLTATEVARNFSAVLDMVEEGEVIEIMRGGKLVAVLSEATQTPDLLEEMQKFFGDRGKPLIGPESADVLEQVLAERYAPENMVFRTSELGERT